VALITSGVDAVTTTTADLATAQVPDTDAVPGPPPPGCLELGERPECEVRRPLAAVHAARDVSSTSDGHIASRRSQREQRGSVGSAGA
jgi:hypothetical protein